MCLCSARHVVQPYADGAEAGVPRRAAELRKAEAVHGELQKEREDSCAAGQPLPMWSEGELGHFKPL